MAIEIAELRTQDCEAVLRLWQDPSNLSNEDGDARAILESHLRLNPGLSLVAKSGDRVVGVVLCGQQGDRGYVNRMVVDHNCGEPSLKKSLVDKALMKLHRRGIRKCHIQVGQEAGKFWDGVRWGDREELARTS